MTDRQNRLLAAGEPPPATVYNEGGRSPFLLVADHAGNAIPTALHSLGLPESERGRHIAWDIGIADVSRMLADNLDATLIQQNYSRLVIDCNRPPGTVESIMAVSESTPVPGNANLSEADIALREREIFWPYHAAIDAELKRRRLAGRPVALVAMHSFTPAYKGVQRTWQAGVLYNRDLRFARVLLPLLQSALGEAVGNNEPYSIDDATDYTIPVHGERGGLHHIGIELRQDLIADERGQRAWATLLAEWLPQAYRNLLAIGASGPG